MRLDRAPLAPDALTSDFVVSLHERSERDRLGLFIAEGLRFFMAARDACAPIAGVVLCPKLLPRGVLDEVSRHVARLRVHRLDVSDREFTALSNAAEPSGLLIVAWQRWCGLPDRVTRDDLWLGLETVRAPGNLGTLIRSAAAFGAKGVMAFGPPRMRCDPFDPRAVRASMGAIFQLSFVGTSHAEFRSWNARHGMRVLGASCDAPVELRRVNLKGSLVFMLGGEREGLSEGQRGSCDGFVRIPTVAGVDSLNVAQAATVLLYEGRVQRRK